MLSPFNQYDLDAIYQNQINIETVEKIVPNLPELLSKAINIFRFIRYYLVEGGLETADIPVTEISLYLEQVGLPITISDQIEILFEQQFPNIYCINFKILEEMELVLIKKYILKAMLDKTG